MAKLKIKFIKLLYLLIFTLCVFSNLEALEFKGKFTQGSYIIGKTDPGTEIKIDNKKIKVSKDGFFVFGLSRDRKNNILITSKKNKVVQIIEKKVFKKKYKI